MLVAFVNEFLKVQALERIALALTWKGEYLRRPLAVERSQP
jgi:hypothetical protein